MWYQQEANSGDETEDWMSRVWSLGICVLVVAGAAGCAGTAPHQEQPSLQRELTEGLATLEVYFEWYEGVGRRLASGTGDVSATERDDFVVVGEALRRIIRGLNVAMGNCAATEAEAPR